MQIDNLSWFPGHMTKTKRMISAEIKNMDAVCEIVDARIPMSSRNPDVDELTAGKPRLIVLNRADQADPAETRRWTQYLRAQPRNCPPPSASCCGISWPPPRPEARWARWSASWS